MSEFPKSSRALDALISSTNDFETIKQIARQQMAKEGRIVLEGDMGAALVPGAAQPVEAHLPVDSRLGTGPAMRVIYPAGNMRFEIYGDDDQELDAIEGRIRSALGAR